MRITPTQEQLQFILCPNRFVIAEANAGAAKTTTLALLARHLLKSNRPEEIVYLCYTEAAKFAFKERCSWAGLSEATIESIQIGTFNDLCSRRLIALQGEPRHRHSWPWTEIRGALIEAVKRARMRAIKRGHISDFLIGDSASFDFDEMLIAFKRMKNRMDLCFLNEFILTPTSASEIGVDFTVAATLKEYESLRLAKEVIARHAVEDNYNYDINARVIEVDRRESLAPLFRIDDDATYDMACAINDDDPIFDLDTHPLKLEAKHLLVDEAHDLNRACFSVVHGIAEQNSCSVHMTGDVDQVVNSDSGAQVDFMRDEFDRTIGPAYRLGLTTCWRFGSSIGDALGKFANKPYRTALNNSTTVELRSGVGVEQLANMIRNRPARRGERAVILRHPGDSIKLEIALANLHVSSRTFGYPSFLERPEIMFLRVIVSWAVGELESLKHSSITNILTTLDNMIERDYANKNSAVIISKSFHNVNGLSRYLGSADRFTDGKPNGMVWGTDYGNSSLELGKIIRTLLQLRGEATPVEMSAVVAHSGLYEFMRRYFLFKSRGDDAVKAISTLMDSDCANVTQWLNKMEVMEQNYRYKGSGSHTTNCELYSVSGAKGLEFENVIIPFCDASSFLVDNQENRNMFYVSASRAKTSLTLLFDKTPAEFFRCFPNIIEGVTPKWQQ